VLRPVVKRTFQPSRVDMLPLALRQSFDTMVTGRPGPVNLDIPYNVFQEEAEVELPPVSHVHGSHRPGASSADLAQRWSSWPSPGSRSSSSAMA
jgi:acetolactate synthase I/II/III large subunit